MTGFVGIIVAAILGVLAPAVRVETRQVAPPPPVMTVPVGLRCPDFYFDALDAGWAPDEEPQLDRIMWRESKCTPTATHRNANGSIDRGLLQVNSIHLKWLADLGISADDLLVPSVNLTAGRRLYEQDGWGPWRPLP